MSFLLPELRLLIYEEQAKHAGHSAKAAQADHPGKKAGEREGGMPFIGPPIHVLARRDTIERHGPELGHRCDRILEPLVHGQRRNTLAYLSGPMVLLGGMPEWSKADKEAGDASFAPVILLGAAVVGLLAVVVMVSI